MSDRVISVVYEGRFKISIRKEGFGTRPLFWYRLEEGYWWQDGGPYNTQSEADAAARAAIDKVTSGIEVL